MKYVFVGNRRFVLDEMLRLRLNIVEIFVVSGTHLENDIKNMKCKYTLIFSKTELIEKLESVNYDILVSNGCPYILPISKMQQKTYINIHPSLLPDLKGVDPVIGSILFNRDAGATCHIMNDNIDGGDIVSQVKIPYSNDLDVSLLYQLSFIAEKESFTKALNLNFKTIKIQEDENDLIYYTRKQKDKHIKFNESIGEMTNKIKAFNNKSQGAFFIYDDMEYKVFDLEILSNEFLRRYASNFEDLKILFCYEDSIIFNKDGCIVKFHQVSGNLSRIQTNTFISQT
jgi:methionyl-tRNA formyltransferase